MRQSFLYVLGVAASMAATTTAHYSKYWTHWDDMMDDMECENGPVACGQDDDGEDLFCMAGYACYHSAAGYSVCDDVARYQCRKACPEGETLNPLRYCTCIPNEEAENMFCASEAPASTTASMASTTTTT